MPEEAFGVVSQAPCQAGVLGRDPQRFGHNSPLDSTFPIAGMAITATTPITTSCPNTNRLLELERQLAASQSRLKITELELSVARLEAEVARMRREEEKMEAERQCVQDEREILRQERDRLRKEGIQLQEARHAAVTLFHGAQNVNIGGNACFNVYWGHMATTTWITLIDATGEEYQIPEYFACSYEVCYHIVPLFILRTTQDLLRSSNPPSKFYSNEIPLAPEPSDDSLKERNTICALIKVPQSSQSTTRRTGLPWNKAPRSSCGSSYGRHRKTKPSDTSALYLIAECGMSNR